MIRYSNQDKELNIHPISVGDKYKVAGDVNGFISKDDIIKYLAEHELHGPPLELSVGGDVLVWNTIRNTRSTDIRAYVNVAGTVAECDVTVTRNGCSSELVEAKDNITSRKLVYDANVIFEKSLLFFEEKEKLRSIPDYSNDIKLALKEEFSNIIVMDDIDLMGDDKCKSAYIPVQIIEDGELSPMVAAKVLVSDGEINIDDVKSKVMHLKEMHFGRIGNKAEKVAKKTRLSYRKTKNNKSSSKKPKNFKNSINVSRSQTNQRKKKEEKSDE